MSQVTLFDLRKIAIKPRRKRYSIVDWLMMKEDEVLSEFAKLPGAQRHGNGDRQFVYIPGTRKDRMLLVAHADTVFNDKPVEVAYAKGYYFSNNDKIGIGADDRAGCNILWKLRNLGHSLLIPNGEESGCVGSEYLINDKSWAEEINKHQFVMQFDRRGSKDLVSYRVGSDQYTKWLESQMPGYKGQNGSRTDICVLCDIDKHKDWVAPCGVNVSVGYYNEHGSSEHLNIRQWNSTLSHTYGLIKQNDLPRFAQEIPSWKTNSYSSRYPNNNQSTASSNVNLATTTQCSSSACTAAIIDDIYVCPECFGTQDQVQLKDNNGLCIFCNKTGK